MSASLREPLRVSPEIFLHRFQVNGTPSTCMYARYVTSKLFPFSFDRLFTFVPTRSSYVTEVRRFYWKSFPRFSQAKRFYLCGDFRIVFAVKESPRLMPCTPFETPPYCPGDWMLFFQPRLNSRTGSRRAFRGKNCLDPAVRLENPFCFFCLRVIGTRVDVRGIGWSAAICCRRGTSFRRPLCVGGENSKLAS